MTKDPRVYLAHILECIEKIERFTGGGKADFLGNVMVQDAVVRNSNGTCRASGKPLPRARRRRAGAGSKKMMRTVKMRRPDAPIAALRGLGFGGRSSLR
jgi:hypothetical protein